MWISQKTWVNNILNSSFNTFLHDSLLDFSCHLKKYKKYMKLNFSSLTFNAPQIIQILKARYNFVFIKLLHKFIT